MISRLGEGAPHEQDSDDDRYPPTGERAAGGEELEPYPGAHQPFAWSTISAVNGRAPGGAIWNVSPHLPTITRAGAARA
jgi:hypothetical protein